MERDESSVDAVAWRGYLDVIAKYLYPPLEALTRGPFERVFGPWLGQLKEILRAGKSLPGPVLESSTEAQLVTQALDALGQLIRALRGEPEAPGYLDQLLPQFQRALTFVVLSGPFESTGVGRKFRLGLMDLLRASHVWSSDHTIDELAEQLGRVAGGEYEPQDSAGIRDQIDGLLCSIAAFDTDSLTDVVRQVGELTCVFLAAEARALGAAVEFEKELQTTVTADSSGGWDPYAIGYALESGCNMYKLWSDALRGCCAGLTERVVAWRIPADMPDFWSPELDVAAPAARLRARAPVHSFPVQLPEPAQSLLRQLMSLEMTVAGLPAHEDQRFAQQVRRIVAVGDFKELPHRPERVLRHVVAETAVLLHDESRSAQSWYDHWMNVMDRMPAMSQEERAAAVNEAVASTYRAEALHADFTGVAFLLTQLTDSAEPIQAAASLLQLISAVKTVCAAIRWCA